VRSERGVQVLRKAQFSEAALGIVIAKRVQLISLGDAQDDIAIPIAADAKTSEQPAKDQIATSCLLC
jgi:hypothetical protein